MRSPFSLPGAARNSYRTGSTVRRTRRITCSRATEHRFLREVALRTWRYFVEFSREENNQLIPDNVQEQPYRIAERISPTNLGLSIERASGRLEFGYLTTGEFVSANGINFGIGV